MIKLPFFSSLALLLLWSCSDSAQTKSSAPARLPPSDSPRIAKAAESTEASKSQTPSGDLAKTTEKTKPSKDLLSEYRQELSTQHQDKKQQAESIYQLAEDYYRKGDLEKAERELRRALEYDPGHAKARERLEEVLRLSGKAQFNIESERLNKMLQEEMAKHEERVRELEHLYQQGMQYYTNAKYDEAEQKFRFLIEKASILPTHVEIEDILKRSRTMLEQTRQKKKEKAIMEEKTREAILQQEAKQADAIRIAEENKRVLLMFELAKLRFEQERYEDVIHLCDNILEIDSTLKPIVEMKKAAQGMQEIAQKLQHAKVNAELDKEYVEQWKRTFEKLDLASILQTRLLEWVDRKTWKEITNRQQMALEFESHKESPDDLRVMEALKNTRTTLDFKDRSLADLIAKLQEDTRLTIVFGKDVDPSAILIKEIKVKDVPVELVLRNIILLPNNLNFYVADGILYIDKVENINKKGIIEFDEVDDLVYALQDFPGPELGLPQNPTGGIGQAPPPPPPQQQAQTRRPLTIEKIQQFMGAIAGKDAQNNDILPPDKIVANGNLITIEAPREVHEKIKKFLASLRSSFDILVSIEARFLQVEDNFLDEIGIEFRDLPTALRGADLLTLDQINIPPPGQPLSPNFGNGQGAGITNANSAGIVTSFGQDSHLGARVEQVTTNDTLLNDFYNQIFSQAGGTSLQAVILDRISAEMILRAVKKKERAHLLRAARITAINTQRVNFVWTIATTFTNGFSGTTNIGAVGATPTFGQILTGIVIDVRPIVSADRHYVMMELRPQLAILQGFADPVNRAQPAVAFQRAYATVMAPDRGTVMLGGLASFFAENYENSIPGVRDIPILGRLGSQQTQGLGRSQILILVTPQVLILEEEEKKQF